MEERAWTYISIIILLLAAAAWWGVRYERQPGPLEMLEEATATIDRACEEICAGGNVTAHLALPAATRMYATEEAICLQRNTSMFCARCGCSLQPAQPYAGEQPANITCTMSAAGIACAT